MMHHRPRPKVSASACIVTECETVDSVVYSKQFDKRCHLGIRKRSAEENGTDEGKGRLRKD